jgi:hypothetical protein
MRQAGLVGASHRHGGPVTTRRDQEARPAPDLVDRKFTAAGPNQLWVADITYVPTLAGFLYLAMVLDAWSRKIVGWSMANHLRTDLVLDAMEAAIVGRPFRPQFLGTVVTHRPDPRTLPSILLPWIDTVPIRSSPPLRASSRTCRKAASNVALFERRDTAIVSWSGCRLAATKPTAISRYVARAIRRDEKMPLA